MFAKLFKRDPAKVISRDIEKQLKDEFRKNKDTHTILLLGTGEAGKTTLIKQMKVIHASGFTDKEKLDKVPDIRNNIHDSIYSIVKNLKQVQPSVEIKNKTSQKAAEFILNLGEEPLDEYTNEYFDNVSKLWQDEDIQRMFKRANEYHLPDSAEEFMRRLDVIRQPNYVPTVQDILYCRVKTTEISIYPFDVQVSKKYGGGRAQFSMIDVGGQRIYRTKWISVFEGIETLLFLISVGEFDQTLREDNTTNRLEESLKLFNNMFNSRYLQSSNAIIFLNKEDILERKIRSGASIGTHFEKYKTFNKSNDEFVNSKLFIEEEVKAITNAAESNRGVYIHFTTATSTQNIKHIFDSVHQIIIESALRKIMPL